MIDLAFYENTCWLENVPHISPSALMQNAVSCKHIRCMSWKSSRNYQNLVFVWWFFFFQITIKQSHFQSVLRMQLFERSTYVIPNNASQTACYLWELLCSSSLVIVLHGWRGNSGRVETGTLPNEGNLRFISSLFLGSRKCKSLRGREISCVVWRRRHGMNSSSCWETVLTWLHFQSDHSQTHIW